MLTTKRSEPTSETKTTDQGRPLPPTMSVRAALGAYLAENGFDTSGYTAPTYSFDVFGVTFTRPNTPDHKWAIPLHDLHHVATGYGTDLVGEAEVAAFELVGGCRTPIVYALNLASAVVVMFLAPRRMWRAFRASRGARTLYRHPHAYEALLDLTLGELRERLGIPAAGLAAEPRRVHAKAPRAVPA